MAEARDSFGVPGAGGRQAFMPPADFDAPPVAPVGEPTAAPSAGQVLPGDSDHDADIDFTDIEESESPKIQALLALKEIEFDRETGKLSDEDYADMKATYQRAALTAIDLTRRSSAW